MLMVADGLKSRVALANDKSLFLDDSVLKVN